MRTKATLFTLAMLFLGAPLVAQGDEVDWKLDNVHSKVGFTAYHLGFSETDGNFDVFAAAIKADEKKGKISALEATAKVDSVDTDNAKRDKHLKGKDFFDAKKFPELKLKLKSIRHAGKRVVAKVALTIHGITRDVTFKGTFRKPVKVNVGAGPQLRAAYKMNAKIDRKKFGLSFNGIAEGISVVSDEVDITLKAQIVRDLPKK